MPRMEPQERAAYLETHRQRREEIAAAVASGKTYREISDAYGISEARVGQIAKKMGVAPGARRKGVRS